MPFFTFFKKNPVPSGVPKNQYVLQGVLQGHQTAVHCMKINADGTLLASGGGDGIYIWDFRKKTPQATLRPVGPSARGATTALLWVRNEDHPGDILVFGTQSGHVGCWTQMPGTMAFTEAYVFQLAHPSEITGLAYEPASQRLAISNRNAVIQVYRLDDELNLRPISVHRIRDLLVPMAIAFTGSVRGQELLLFANGEHDGHM
ncbi:WD40-repeat-containing domain protein [Mycena galopus ATCC 62051]|nr:WD40-repeat-containing domain protein [Mycena galopus ATCC 62051]